jgi:hypothetical protein
MNVCEKFDWCRFILQSMPGMPQTSKLVQHSYCRSNFMRCARYRVGKTLGSQAVPDTLSPGDSLQADLLLAAAMLNPNF